MHRDDRTLLPDNAVFTAVGVIVVHEKNGALGFGRVFSSFAFRQCGSYCRRRKSIPATGLGKNGPGRQAGSTDRHLRGSRTVYRAPHTNAAKVFINWFLSRRGQIVYQESHGDRDSLRIDVPKDKVPAVQRRLAGRKYFFVEGPEYIDVKPAVKIIDDALAGKGRSQ